MEHSEEITPSDSAPESVHIEAADASAEAVDEGARSSQAAPETDTSVADLEAYRGFFPSAEDAGKIRDLLEGVGGEQGLQQLQQDLQTWSGLERSFTEDPASFAKTLAEADPAAFSRAAPQMVDQWSKTNPQEYQQFSTQIALSAMTQMGLDQRTLAELHAQANGNPYAQHLIASLHTLVGGLQGRMQQPRQQQQDDPARRQLEKERQEFEATKQTAFESGVTSGFEKLVKEQAAPVLKEALGAQLPPDAVRELIDSGVMAEVASRMSAIPGVDARMTALEKAKDSKGLAELFAKHLPAVLKPAVSASMQKYVGKGAQRAPADEKPSGPRRLTEAPNPNTLDKYPNWQTDFMLSRGKQKGVPVSW